MLNRHKKLLTSLLTVVYFLSLVAGSIVYAQPSQAAKATKVATRTITDMAGRKVTVPSQIKKIYTTSPIGQITLYSLNPDKLIGWNYKMTAAEAKFIQPRYRSLPVFGGPFGKASTLNPEALIKAKPDIIINMGNIDDLAISSSDKLQKQLNIPVVMVDGKLMNMDKAYTYLGDLLGEKVKAKELATFCRTNLSGIQGRAKAIPENKKVRVYYAEGLKGLETDPKGSTHTEVLDLVGGLNVADIGAKSGYGRAQVSLEQVIVWNPDTIIICPEDGNSNPFYKEVMTDGKWSSIKAVKNKQVYIIPFGPFNWFDRPPSVNRVLGSLWLGNLLYPDIYKYDMKAKTKEFYAKFYHYKLTDKEVNELLQYGSHKK
jgi:iron complex transport system substrate-binding protein